MLPLNGPYNLLTCWTCWFFIIIHIVDDVDVFIFWNQNQTFTFTFIFHHTTNMNIFFHYQSNFFAFTELHCWIMILIKWNKIKLSNNKYYINSPSQITHHLRFFIFLMLHRSKHWFIWFKNSFDKRFNKTLFTISQNYLCQIIQTNEFFSCSIAVRSVHSDLSSSFVHFLSHHFFCHDLFIFVNVDMIPLQAHVILMKNIWRIQRCFLT